MYKTAIIITAILLSLFILTTNSFAQETFTLTTYYPAPFGIYQRLVTQTLGVGNNNPDVAGIDASDAPDPATNPGDVWIAGNVGIRTTNPVYPLDIQSPSGYDAWVKIGSTDINTADADAGILLYEGPWTATGENQQWAIFNEGLNNVAGIGDVQRLVFANGPGTQHRMAFTYANNEFRVGIESGTGVNTLPQAKLDVAGGVKIGNTTACAAGGGQNGTIRYNSGLMQYCNNGSWVNMSGGDFGGMFDISGMYLVPTFGCTRANPYTGNCSCPPGYNTEPLTGGLVSPISGWVALSDHWIFYCWR